jgi:phosphoribosylaminoimidazolecarboxamide formyltransferase / IMP cyclohydrolase
LWFLPWFFAFLLILPAFKEYYFTAMEASIKTALISVFHKDGLDEIIHLLNEHGVVIYSTGGTRDHIESLGIKVEKVEDLTGYPSILDGRVKTLHPKVFGGILAKREPDHQAQLTQYAIPNLDLVIVDLYPFEKTVASTSDETTIIEKIDIGGISLIRAAAKNFNDVVIIPSQDDYAYLKNILATKGATTSLIERKYLAGRAFDVSSHYDAAIFKYFTLDHDGANSLKVSMQKGNVLRYGENPHQQAIYFGELDSMFEFKGGKSLSFNNMVDVDAAVILMREFKDNDPTFCIIKHTNACGVATRETALEAWHAALAADPTSAFGGIFITNTTVDINTAQEIDKLFYEILIAHDYTDEALKYLTKKDKRIIIKLKHYDLPKKHFKSLLNGVISQDADTKTEDNMDLKVVTKDAPSASQIEDLLFANKCVKHLKSNTIVLVKNSQMIGMGCGQTSRVDACNQAIAKAKSFGFDVEGSVMASDAFFPFPDCVEIAYNAGVKAVIQPGGSIKDQLSIDFCNAHKMPMVTTGIRHFKH